jgi:hypothetical protein
MLPEWFQAKMEAIAGIVSIPSRGSGVDNKELQQLRDKMKAMCKIESKKGEEMVALF